MLITELKSRETLEKLARGKVFAIVCHGCKEIYFPVEEVNDFLKDISDRLVGTFTTEYICNTDNLPVRLPKYEAQLREAATVLVFSCGVGVQTLAQYLHPKYVVACCDTYPLPGYQGVTPLEHDCKQCGQCFLNLTGGICPLTACSKSLVNGQCGGSKDGKCEVDPSMECGWERIYRKLEKLGRLDALKCPIQIRNYATDDEV